MCETPSFTSVSPMQTKQFEIALSTFEKIQAAFPALSMKLDLHHAHVDLAKGAIALHCTKIVQKRAVLLSPISYLRVDGLGYRAGKSDTPPADRNAWVASYPAGLYSRTFARARNGHCSQRARISAPIPARGLRKQVSANPV